MYVPGYVHPSHTSTAACTSNQSVKLLQINFTMTNMTMSNLRFFQVDSLAAERDELLAVRGSEPGTQDAMCATKISQVLTEISNACPEVGI